MFFLKLSFLLQEEYLDKLLEKEEDIMRENYHDNLDVTADDDFDDDDFNDDDLQVFRPQMFNILQKISIAMTIFIF